MKIAGSLMTGTCARTRRTSQKRSLGVARAVINRGVPTTKSRITLNKVRNRSTEAVPFKSEAEVLDWAEEMASEWW